METTGKLFELFGTLITLGGLWYAWWKASMRNNAWRARIVASLEAGFRCLARPGIPAPAPHESRTVHGNDDGVVTERARVFRHEEPLNQHFGDVYQELDAARADFRADVEAVRREVEAAFTEAITQMKTEQNAHAVRDLTVALCGIGITGIGILIGICA